MQILWTRGGETISFRRPHTYFILGVRDSGKSSLLESLAEEHLKKNHVILDLFGSRDGESLAWLRSPWAEEKRILLLCGDNVDVQSTFETKHVGKVTLQDFENYDIIINSSPLYSSMDMEFNSVNRVIDLLYQRRHHKRMVFGVIREASNLYYSRLKISKDQSEAKASMIYLLREARHAGLALGLDSLKFTSIDLDVRVLIDYLFLKSQGALGLPRDLHWVYGEYEPNRLQNLPKKLFAIVSKNGSIGLGIFKEIPWHKQEKEDIVRSVGLKIEYGEPLQGAEDKGIYKTVSDEEHVDIITRYLNGEGGMGALGKTLNRSGRTIQMQLGVHDEAVKRSGFCARCKRARSDYYSTEVKRTKERTIT